MGTQCFRLSWGLWRLNGKRELKISALSASKNLLRHWQQAFGVNKQRTARRGSEHQDSPSPPRGLRFPQQQMNFTTGPVFPWIFKILHKMALAYLRNLYLGVINGNKSYRNENRLPPSARMISKPGGHCSQSMSLYLLSPVCSRQSLWGLKEEAPKGNRRHQRPAELFQQWVLKPHLIRYHT